MSDIILRDGIRSFLLQKLREEHGTVLSPDEVTFQEVTLLDPSVTDYSDPDKRNTSVRIKKEASGGDPEVSVLLRYNRVLMSKLFYLRETTLPYDASFTSLHQYLPAINARLGTALQPEDLVDEPLDGNPPQVTLRAPESSLYAFGSQTVTLVDSSTPQPPEEEDEMYYTLVASQSTDQFNADANVFQFSIGDRCGYPTFFKPSGPEDLFVTRYNGTLQELTMVSNAVHMLSNDRGAVASTDWSHASWAISEYGPTSNFLVEEGSEYVPTLIGELEAMPQLSSSNELFFRIMGDSWVNPYSSNNGRLLRVSAVFTHPDFTDAKGALIKIYWSRVIPLTIETEEPQV